MELLSALKQAESTLTLISDRVGVLKAKLEDLVFRAQKIAQLKKAGGNSTDSMFGYDLQAFRRDVRTFSHEVSALPTTLGGIERTAVYDENAAKLASSLMRLADRLRKALEGLYDQALMAHSHIRESDHKVEAWYIVQEVEQMAEKGKLLPTIANKVLIVVSTPPGKGS